jgi:hypothetical protein
VIVSLVVAEQKGVVLRPLGAFDDRESGFGAIMTFDVFEAASGFLKDTSTC